MADLIVPQAGEKVIYASGLIVPTWYRLLQRMAALINAPQVPALTVSQTGSVPAEAGKLIYVSNEAGGAVLAFGDGTNWRRVTDRAVIS